MFGTEFESKGRIVKVHSWEGERNSSHLKQYPCTCSVCSVDEEMFPNKYFLATKRQIENKTLGCGCTRRILDTRQKVLLLSRIFKDTAVIFLGYHAETNKVYYTFKGLSETLSCTYRHAITKKDKLPYPRERRLWNYKSENFYKDYLSKWKDRWGDKFSITKVDFRTDGEGNWKFNCKDCSSDLISNTLGLDTFYTRGSSFKNLTVPCRCGNYKYSLEEKEALAKDRCETLGGIFLGIEPVGTKDDCLKVKWLCPERHEVLSPYYGLVVKKKGCNVCTNGIDYSKPIYVYLCKWFKSGKVFYKFGLTTVENNSRFYQQKLKASADNYEVLFKEKFDNGYEGLSFEGLFKSVVEYSKELSPVEKELLPDGYTESFHFKDFTQNDKLATFLYNKVKEALEAK